ncbi:MAG TPA: hypothetical protein DEQ28_01710 [Clostridiales bacterium]|nr:hypothetical protein [Clostridiales bacterium]
MMTTRFAQRVREAVRFALGAAVVVAVLRPLADWTALPVAYHPRLAAALLATVTLAWALACRPRQTLLGLAIAAAMVGPAGVALGVDFTSLLAWLTQAVAQSVTAWSHGLGPPPDVLTLVLAMVGMLVSLVVAILVVRANRPLVLVPLGTMFFAAAWLLHQGGATPALAAYLLPVCLLAGLSHLGELAAGATPSPRLVLPTIVSVTILVGLATGGAAMLPGHFRPIPLGRVADWFVDVLPFLADLRGYGEGDGAAADGGFSVAVTGFGGNVEELGGPIRTDDDIVLRLRIANPPPGPLLYLRGSIRDVYTGRGWRRRPRRPAELPDPGTIAFPYPDGIPNWQVAVAVQHVGLRTGVVFSPLQPVAIQGLRQAVSLDALGNLSIDGRVPAEQTYRVLARIPLPMPAAAPLDHNADVSDDYLQLPADLPARIGELARAITRQAGDDLARARAIQAYLRGIPYSEQPPLTPRHRDFVDFFLFDLRRGYCTYHSTAMVVLLRSVGVAARWVEGFAVPLPPAAAGVVEIPVANKQAHAWVEAFIPGTGWFTFEPTPAFPEPDPALVPAFAGPVPGLPLEGQDLPGQRWDPGGGWGDLFLDLIEGEMTGGWQRRAHPLRGWLGPVTLALLAIGAGCLIWLAARRAWRLWLLTRPRLHDRRAAIDAVYRGAGHYLSLLSAVPAAADTPAEYLERGRLACPPAGQALAALTGICERARFGPGTPDPPELTTALRTARVIREEVRKALGGPGPLLWRLLAGPSPPPLLTRANRLPGGTVRRRERSPAAARRRSRR